MIKLFNDQPKLQEVHMRTETILFSLFLLLSICPVVMGQTAKSHTAEELMNHFVKLWNQDDSAAVHNAFAEDAMVLISDETGGKPIRGIQTIEKEFINYNLPINSELKVQTIDQGMGTDLAYHMGTYTNHIAISGEKPYTQTGRHAFVWKRTGGSWKLQSVLIDPDPAPKE